MDDYMMYKLLHEMKENKDMDFIDKFREYMSNPVEHSHYKHEDPSWAFMPSKDKSHWDFYMRRDGRPMHEDYTKEDMMRKMMEYMHKHRNSITEEDAKYIVANMHHEEGSKVISGEYFAYDKTREIMRRYANIIGKDIDCIEFYIAINAQYHDYAALFKSWFGNNIDHKIIESAITFWFKDEDYKHESKVKEYFK